eukprot:89941_1
MESLNPKWNDSFTFYQCIEIHKDEMMPKQKPSTIQFEVFDMDLIGADDLIGAVGIQLSLNDQNQPQFTEGKALSAIDITKPNKLNLNHNDKGKSKGFINVALTCEFIMATRIDLVTEEKSDDSGDPSTSIRHTLTQFPGASGTASSPCNINWICDNMEDLKDITRKITRKRHKWSANDFSNIDAPPTDLHHRFKDYYLEFVKYATNKEHRVVYFDANVYEVAYDRGSMPWEYNDTLLDITDALWVMFRQYFILNVLLHGQEEEFNIFRSYYFTSGTDEKDRCSASLLCAVCQSLYDASDAQKKLSLSLLSMLLQVALTVAIVYQVIVDWHFDILFDDRETIILICAILIFVYLAFTTDSTIRKCTAFYENINVICVIPWYFVIGDFIVNVLVPIAICCVSFFFLLQSETLGDLVLNSFALTFVYQLDDDINVFENDEDHLLREDINLFLKQKRAGDPCDESDGKIQAKDGYTGRLHKNRRQIHMVNTGFVRLLTAPLFILSNFWHALTFVYVVFIKRKDGDETGSSCCNCGGNQEVDGSQSGSYRSVTQVTDIKYNYNSIAQ